MFKILVVDDEEWVRKGIIMETDWAALDCMVVGEASDGEEGLEAIKKYHPDLVICDIRMPKLDGVSMLQKLRETGDKTELLFLTAFSDFQYAQSAVKLSAADYLLKPFEDGELEQAVLRIKKGRENGEVQAEEENSGETEFQLVLPKGDKSKYVTEALNFIAENLGNQELCVGMITEYLGLSEGHLSHIFKKETNYTINAYITRYRIRSAMKLLRDCRVKVYEVAEQEGYKDITYFSAVFKKLVGVNPSEYQDRCK
ncbi:MAG: response regulator [Lachnospiraceae bacterium]|nr:response regulator [Lachnospiraceae bacterium]